MRIRTPTSSTVKSARISWLIASASASRRRNDVDSHDLAGGLVDPRVVDALLEIVVDSGRLEIEHELDIDLERLGRGQLVLVVAVLALELHVVEHDPVAQREPPSLGLGGGRQVCLMIASLMRATRTFA